MTPREVEQILGRRVVSPSPLKRAPPVTHLGVGQLIQVEDLAMRGRAYQLLPAC